MPSFFKIGCVECSSRILNKSVVMSPFTIGTQLNSLRFKSGNNDCDRSTDTKPRCSEEQLAGSACVQRKKMEKQKGDKKGKKNTFKSMWENPECCLDPCPDLMPRFDDLYYRPSDKSKRPYQETWIECRRKTVPKMVCDLAPGSFPPIKRRKRCGKKPTTARVPKECGLKGQGDQKCSRIGLPGCKKVRIPPSCKIGREVTDCKKVCCPYPAFSECIKEPSRKPRPTECGCLRPRSNCSMFDYLRRMTNAKMGLKR